MTSQLSTNLKRRASAWAGQLTSLARSLAPNHVRSAISSHVEEKSEGTFIIRITADRRKAPDARAQEYGSGLHARRGVKAKYPIRPKTKKALVFMGTNGYGNEFSVYNPITHQGTGDRNIVVTKLVNHPGIEAANEGQGYIAPAVKELKKRARAELDKEIRSAILGDLRKSFGRKE